MYVRTLPLRDVVPRAAEHLRAPAAAGGGGADVVVAVCLDGPQYWRREWEGLASLSPRGPDVLIPPPGAAPHPAAAGDGENATWVPPPPAGEGGTWVLPPLPNGADDLLVVDLRWGEAGELQRPAARAVSVVDLPPRLASTPEFAADAAWLQAEVDRAASNDPVVGLSAGAMPDGGTRAVATGTPSRCRWDRCALGALGNAAVREYLARQGDPVDVVMQNGGSMHKGWAEGSVTMSDLFAAYPYVNAVCRFRTTGPELWRVADGLRWKLDPRRPVYHRLVEFEARDRSTGQWAPVGLGRERTVACAPSRRAFSSFSPHPCGWKSRRAESSKPSTVTAPAAPADCSRSRAASAAEPPRQPSPVTLAHGVPYAPLRGCMRCSCWRSTRVGGMPAAHAAAAAASGAAHIAATRAR
eukprot:gene1677-2698_t